MHGLNKQYALITANYGCFTITDGALRMLVVLYFYELGYSPLEIAMLFLFYEFFGVVTNLFGGWLATRIGLNKTMNIGLALQVAALMMLAVPADWLSVGYVMSAQALSGIAKDLNKMSAKSSVKLLLREDQQHSLYKWVAVLTGSKNALKGAGYFIGGLLLVVLGFQGALLSLSAILSCILLISVFFLKKDLGTTKYRIKFREIFSKSPAINILSSARFFLFGARDVWFVVALPVFLSSQLGWTHTQVGSFLGLWIIGYGVVQAIAPKITTNRTSTDPSKVTIVFWLFVLSVIPFLLALAIGDPWASTTFDTNIALSLILGLSLFGVAFAINSSLHSYLIVSYANRDGISLDVGFYYMANAMGRLVGTLLSGWIYQVWGLGVCLMLSTIFLLLATTISTRLPPLTAAKAVS